MKTIITQWTPLFDDDDDDDDDDDMVAAYIFTRPTCEL